MDARLDSERLDREWARHQALSLGREWFGGLFGADIGVRSNDCASPETYGKSLLAACSVYASKLEALGPMGESEERVFRATCRRILHVWDSRP